MNEFLMKIIKLTFFFQLIVFTSCSHIIECKYMAVKKEYDEITQIPRENKAERIQRFSQYPVEKQIDIYLYAMHCPNDPNIGPLLYENGGAKIPNIVRRIQTTEKVWDKADLVGILSNINAKCRCITKDSDVIKVLEKVERDMNANSSDDVYKKSYTSNLKFLKEQLDEK